jgi:uncharacterized protein with FMN-binding domain
VIPAQVPMTHHHHHHHHHSKKHHRVVTEKIDGDIVGTRYGPVQVRVTLRGKRIVDVVALKDPDDLERSRQIDADALPKLRAAVLSAQSAHIDGVSGATYTSQAYEQSVQSALDLG